MQINSLSAFGVTAFPDSLGFRLHRILSIIYGAHSTGREAGSVNVCLNVILKVLRNESVENNEAHPNRLDRIDGGNPSILMA